MTGQTGEVGADGLLAGYLSRAQLAKHLGLSTDTIARWETLGKGPPRVRIGARCYYRRAAVEEWLLARETGAGADREPVRRARGKLRGGGK
jgi:predicted DNA-binding transcriptional regulator AlpA